jgi:hypothetical protein
MEKKVVSIEVIRQYKEFYSKPENRELSKHVFMKCDIRIEKITKIS